MTADNYVLTNAVWALAFVLIVAIAVVGYVVNSRRPRR